MGAVRPEKRSDCDRCAALCCIAYPSDDMPGFAAAKGPGEPCPKLDSCGRCTIYETRSEEGFAGCEAFECFGAGQHVVHVLFGGRHWRDDPGVMAPMVEAFVIVKKACELLYLVDYARGREVSDADLDLLDDLERQLVAVANEPASATVLPGIEQRLRDLFETVRSSAA